jgi:hypothetical protein
MGWRCELGREMTPLVSVSNVPISTKLVDVESCLDGTMVTRLWRGIDDSRILQICAAKKNVIVASWWIPPVRQSGVPFLKRNILPDPTEFFRTQFSHGFFTREFQIVG